MRLPRRYDASVPRFRRWTTEELVASRPHPESRERERLPVIVLLDDIRSAHNVGLLFRLCDCVGVSELWLGGITPFPGVSERVSKKLGKTAVGGSLDVVPWRHVSDSFEAVSQKRAEGWRIIAIEQGTPTDSYLDLEYGSRAVLVFGHERAGVRDSILGIAHQVGSLPVHGITNSLNVATCASVVLYEASRKMRQVWDPQAIDPRDRK